VTIHKRGSRLERREMTVSKYTGSFCWDSGKKGEFTDYGRKGKKLKGSTGVSLGHTERKLDREKPS